MFSIARTYRFRSGEGALDEALDKKNEVFARYWCPKDELSRPDSLSWPSEHEPRGVRPSIALPRRAGGCFTLRWPNPHGQIAYVVEPVAGAAKITQIDADWGGGLIWLGPTPKPSRMSLLRRLLP
jgi:hypothetical protein